MKTLSLHLTILGLPRLLAVEPTGARDLSTIELETDDGVFQGTLDELFDWADTVGEKKNSPKTIEGTEPPTFNPTSAPSLPEESSRSNGQPVTPIYADINPATPIFSPVNDRMVPTDVPYAPPGVVSNDFVFNGKCNLCGHGIVTFNDVITEIEPGDPKPCGELFVEGLLGFIDRENCALLPDLIGETCGCSNYLAAPPSPVVPPIMPPVGSSEENRESPTEVDPSIIDVSVPSLISLSPSFVSRDTPTVTEDYSNESISPTPTMLQDNSNTFVSPTSSPSIPLASAINATSSETLSPVVPLAFPSALTNPTSSPNFQLTEPEGTATVSPTVSQSNPSASVDPMLEDSFANNQTASPVFAPSFINTNYNSSDIKLTSSPVLPPSYLNVSIGYIPQNSSFTNTTKSPILPPSYIESPNSPASTPIYYPFASPTRNTVDEGTMGPVVNLVFSESPTSYEKETASVQPSSSSLPTLQTPTTGRDSATDLVSELPSTQPAFSGGIVDPASWWRDDTLIGCDNGTFSGLEIVTFEYAIEILGDYDIDQLIVELESKMNLFLANALLPCYQEGTNRRLEENVDTKILGVDSLPLDEPSTRTFCGPSLDPSNKCLVIEGVMQTLLAELTDSDIIQYRVLSSLRDYLNGSPVVDGLVLSKYLTPEIVDPLQQAGIDSILESPNERSSGQRNSRMQAVVLFAIAATAFTASLGIILLFRNRYKRSGEDKSEEEHSQGSISNYYDFHQGQQEVPEYNFDTEDEHDEEVMSPFSSMLPSAYRLDSPSINTRSLVGGEMAMIREDDECDSVSGRYRVASEGSMTDESEMDISSILNISHLSQAPVLGAVRRKEEDNMVDLC